jgi:hypothetical protein
MKTLNVLIIMLFTSFFATLSYADIHFLFKHNPSPANANLPLSIQPTLYIGAQKENGVHLAQSESARNQKNEQYPGESSEDSVHSSLFAPDPSGTYIISINCYLRENTGAKSVSTFTKNIPLKNYSTVSIEAECPLINDNSIYRISPPKNIIIKVDNNFESNYIMGAPTQEGVHK